MKKNLLYSILFCIACSCPIALFSQNIGPSFGTVTDSISRKPIEGATIYIVGKEYDVKTTDAKGTFRITIYSPPKTLVITAKGYITTEVMVLKSQERLNVMLKPVAQQNKLRKRKK